MNPVLDGQIEELQKAIAGLEAQRAVLGESVVENALSPLRQRLEEMLGQRQIKEPAVPAPVEQRKLVSVLCADLAGFTALSTTLDPEELREIQQAYFEAMTPPILERSGLVEKYIGDAVLAVFGMPQAHEDDPERAVRAALEMQSALEQLNAQHAGETGFPLLMRVGVSTGTVLATLKAGAGDFVVTGETVNLASRIQNLAPPGGVLIPQDTYRHVRGVFDVLAMEPVQVKGLPEPLAVYQVLQAKPRAFRPVVLGVEGVETPLVGRQAELRYLQDALMGAIEEREGQVVTVCGEAGVGKSRLLYEFQNWFELLPQRVRFFQGKARQEALGLPYALLRDLFAFRFQVLDDDPADKVRRKLETGFEEVFGDREEGMMRSHFLGQLLGYNFSFSPHLERVIGDAEQLRNRGLMYLVEYFKALCERGPVIVLLEDLHWADDSSLDAVNKLGEQAHHLGLLLVGAARRTLLERRPFWGEGLGYHHFIELQPLSKRESRQLVGEILKLVEAIPTELRELLVEGGEGNPFYIEELVKMLVESGVVIKGEDLWQIEAERLRQLTVPPTLAGVLQARLDALPAGERVVLQQASVVGRLFWDQVVAYIHTSQAGEKEETSVPQALSSLRGRELVYRHEESTFLDSTEYLFKHDLLREVTYESVLKRLRKAYHAMAADWLIAHCGERIGEHRGLIAEHLLLGGRNEQALDYFKEAGEAALAAFSNPEAEAYFRRALDLVPGQAQRAAILAGLGETLRRQARHEEAAQIFRWGIDLYQQLGDMNQVAMLYANLSLLLWSVSYLQAWQISQEGLETLEGAPASLGYANLLVEAGRTAHFKFESAELVISLCQRAIAMAEQLGEITIEAEALITLALQSENIPGAIEMIEKAAKLMEGKGLSSTSARAHTDLGYYKDYYIIDLNAGLRHRLKAADIYIQIGDIDGMFLSLQGAAHIYLEMGIFDFLSQIEAEFIQNSNASRQQVDEFLGDSSVVSACKLFYLGEWQQTLERVQLVLAELHKGAKLQLIAECEWYIVFALLELNYFSGWEDISESETALMEMSEIGGLDHHEVPFLRVVVAARHGRLADAHTGLTQAKESLRQPENGRVKFCRLNAEAELALAEGRWDQAVFASQSLADIFQAAGARWWWARELIRLGDAYFQRNAKGDIIKGKETYQKSLEIFKEIGAPGYIAAIESRLKVY